jgi:hypothetical protein
MPAPSRQSGIGHSATRRPAEHALLQSRAPERWMSGLSHTPGKRAWGNTHRGFESALSASFPMKVRRETALPPQRTRLRFCACRHHRECRPGTTSHPSTFEWQPAHGTMPPMARQARRIGLQAHPAPWPLPAPRRRCRRAWGPCWRESAPTPPGDPHRRLRLSFRGWSPAHHENRIDWKPIGAPIFESEEILKNFEPVK